MPHAEAVRWADDQAPAPVSARRRMVVRQLPRFMLCWLGLAAPWHAVPVVESLLTPPDALLALVGGGARPVATGGLRRTHPAAPPPLPIAAAARPLTVRA